MKTEHYNEAMEIFAERMHLDLISKYNVAPQPLKVLEDPFAFQAGDIFGGSFSIGITSGLHPQFVFETQRREFVLVPLYGFFTQYSIGEQTSEGLFVETRKVSKYEGPGFDAIKEIYDNSRTERDFVEALCIFLETHQLAVSQIFTDPRASVKRKNGVTAGYSTYTLSFV